MKNNSYFDLQDCKKENNSKRTQGENNDMPTTGNIALHLFILYFNSFNLFLFFVFFFFYFLALG